MKIKIGVLGCIGLLALFTFTACQGENAFYNLSPGNNAGDTEQVAEYSGEAESKENGNETSTGKSKSDGTLQDSRLTEQEKTFVGIWESEDGYLLAVRERAISQGASDSFPLDAMIFEPFYVIDGDPLYDGWSPVTRREDGYSIVEDGYGLLLLDAHECPTDATMTRYETQLYHMEYDPATDTVTYSYYVGGDICSHPIGDGEESVEQIVLYKTDKDIEESVPWDWYYNSHPADDPR